MNLLFEKRKRQSSIKGFPMVFQDHICPCKFCDLGQLADKFFKHPHSTQGQRNSRISQQVLSRKDSTPQKHSVAAPPSTAHSRRLRRLCRHYYKGVKTRRRTKADTIRRSIYRTQFCKCLTTEVKSRNFPRTGEKARPFG